MEKNTLGRKQKGLNRWKEKSVGSRQFRDGVVYTCGRHVVRNLIQMDLNPTCPYPSTPPPKKKKEGYLQFLNSSEMGKVSTFKTVFCNLFDIHF